MFKTSHMYTHSKIKKLQDIWKTEICKIGILNNEILLGNLPKEVLTAPLNKLEVIEAELRAYTGIDYFGNTPIHLFNPDFSLTIKDMSIKTLS